MGFVLVHGVEVGRWDLPDALIVLLAWTGIGTDQRLRQDVLANGTFAVLIVFVVLIKADHLAEDLSGDTIHRCQLERCYAHLNVVQAPDDRLHLVVVHPV